MEDTDYNEDWITIGSVPTHVCTWGGWITDKSIPPDEDNNISDNNKKPLILLVSGNPGIVKYYQTFLATLYKRLMVPVWILSHAGHEVPPKNKNIPTLPDGFELYDVVSQVSHKAEFIQRYIPSDRDIYIIAHSFGAKVTVELLKQESFRKRIKKCYLVFPTLERIAETPNGKFIQFVINYLFSITILFSFLFSVLPYLVKWWLIKTYFFLNGRFNFPSDCITGTIDLVNATSLSNVFNLARDEMFKICELDKEVIEECVNKLRIYFGANDGWAPVSYHENLIKEVPKVDSRVLDKKYEHCFMFHTAKEFALELAEHIEADLK